MASINAAGDRCVNLYPELIESGTGKAKYTLTATPGTELFCTLPATVRALWAGDNRMFAVAGSTLYEVFSNGSYSTVGTLNSDTNPAHIFSNGAALMIISGTQMYIADGSSVYEPQFIDDTEYVTAVSGTYLDGYFIVLRPDSNQINISDLLSPDWQASEFATRIGGQDRMMAVFTDHQQLWMFGQKTTELWYNSGDGDFPFQRIEGSWVEQGLWARHSVAKVDNTIMWLGGDDRGVGVVWRAKGYLPQRVSTFAIEYAIRSYSTTTDAVGFAYQERGHNFYVLTFPTAAKTWVYDCNTDLWHERGFLSGGSLIAWAMFHCNTFSGNDYIAPGTNGKILRVSSSLYADEGSSMRRIRQAPHLSDEQKIIIHDRFQLDMDVGTVTGSAPMVSMEISNDGGKTFGTAKSATAGASGETKKRVIWRRLGAARDRVYRITQDSTEFVSWLAAYLSIRPGSGA